MTARAGATDGGRAGREGPRPPSADDLERAHDGRGSVEVDDAHGVVVRVGDEEPPPGDGDAGAARFWGPQGVAVLVAGLPAPHEGVAASRRRVHALDPVVVRVGHVEHLRGPGTRRRDAATPSWGAGSPATRTATPCGPQKRAAPASPSPGGGSSSPTRT